MQYLTVINGNKYTGVQYTDDNANIRTHHANQGELLVWLDYRLTLDADGKPIETPDIDTFKNAKLQQADTKKKTMLDAGFTVNGTLFDSDINARMAYSDFVDYLLEFPNYSTPWKAANNVWVTMDAELYAQIKIAGKEHIESVFAWLAGKQSEINAAETIADLQSIVI